MEQGCALQRVLVYFRGPRGALEVIHVTSLQSGRKQWGVAIFWCRPFAGGSTSVSLKNKIGLALAKAFRNYTPVCCSKELHFVMRMIGS